MRKLIIAIVSVLSSQLIQAQTAYVELGGPGLASLNFDTRFTAKEDGIGGRVGVGGFSISDGNGNNAGVVFIPLGVNYLFGKDERNYFEVGGGITPVLGTGNSGSDFSETFGHILFGYRMQPKAGGFTFRAFISPIFASGTFIPYYGGLSFGYKFNAKKE